VSVTAAKGFRAAGVIAGIKASGRADLALVSNLGPLQAAAGVFTSNRFSAAPVQWSQQVIADGQLAAVVLNSGGANACTGDAGYADSVRTAELVGAALGCPAEQVAVCSTGLIGVRLPMDAVANGITLANAALAEDGGPSAAAAIMTTDTVPKQAAHASPSGWTVGGMAKGAGMLAPALATMLVVLMCDAKVGSLWWQEAVAAAADRSFNSITVDGDTSTNDCVLALANGASDVVIDTAEGRQALLAVMADVCQALAAMLVQDAEGGTKVLRIKVVGAVSHADAELAARAVGNSPLVKTAFFGRDANWGRIVAALGRSGAVFDPEEVSVRIGGVPVFEGGMPVADDLDALLAPHMRRGEIPIDVELGGGPGRYLLLASDLTYDYIKINADYRT